VIHGLEFEEWGDPRNREIYDVMKTYCPYTNISGELLAKNEYPHMLVIGGMNDPRVAFFEPLKFVAKIRGERSKWTDILKKKGSIMKIIYRSLYKRPRTSYFVENPRCRPWRSIRTIFSFGRLGF
jgi:hypothetical protein